jgi:DNA-binding transcriptional ArsR family regulator
MPAVIAVATGVPRGFRQRIRDHREAAIARVLAEASRPLTAGEIGRRVGMSGHEVGRLLRVHIGTGAVTARRESSCGARCMVYELPESVRMAVIADVMQV